MNTAFDKVLSKKIVPVVVIHDANDVDPLSEALIDGGLPCAEITFRTAAALEAIYKMARRGDMLVGAGTVLSVAQVKQAVDAGAGFIVAPGLNPKVVTYCVENDIPVTPGVCTPSDIEAALDLGVEVLKFFPAGAFGGVKTLKALGGPYTTARFIPTGGINADNLADYLALPKVVACGGSWMVKSSDITGGAFEKIARLTREAVEIAQPMAN
jgi:2-dehydro-3-deoxyphosphogluconate aldolase/(4S)-4-hydroxy-2-oxoglutarate aldolase